MTGQAEVLSGGLALVADHLVLALRESPEDAQPSFVLSWYVVTWAAAAPPGNLAFVRSATLPTGEAVLTDAPELDRALRARLRPRAWPLHWPDRPATPATFGRGGSRDGIDGHITAADMHVEVGWRALAPPIVASGRVGDDPPWDSTTVLVEAAGWTARVDGTEVTGAPFPNDVWMAWFGRPLSSALVAFAEVFREAVT